jgi:hypothetical protein
MGLFKGEGGSVPIYGIDTMVLTKSSNWKVSSLGISMATLALWLGDTPVEYSFEFNIVAGVGEVSSRKALYEKMKLMHSWAAHTGEGKTVTPPVVVELVVAGYINSKGVIKNVSTAAAGPWDADSSVRYPTTCKFSGVFLLLPGYTEKGVDLVLNSSKLSASEVRSSFYRG